MDPYLNQLNKPFLRQTVLIKHRFKYWVTINFVRYGMLQIFHEFVLKQSKEKKWKIKISFNKIWIVIEAG